jgi:hypothetical protein
MRDARRFPRGSEWRKWDLHVHSPETHLHDAYKADSKDAAWERFCGCLANSDVAVYGIADYFSLDGFFATKKRFEELQPDSQKVLLPNLELRLNETVNGKQQEVHLHLLLRPDLDEETAKKLLGSLKTEISDPERDRNLTCDELSSTDQRERATVSRESIKQALKDTFGTKRPRYEDALIVVAANNSGIRADDGVKRKANLADSIDRMTDAVFGHADNRDHYLNPGRSRDGSSIPPKPVFGGSDAHDFETLEGSPRGEPNMPSTVTWIKADPTFDGLLQTLVEPGERVQLRAAQPDRKDPYKVISEVRFYEGEEGKFPERLMFNPNLVSIIGSRSSGKSALLAYIAHAIDPDYAERQQAAADRGGKGANVGPAPGLSWGDVEEIRCEVEWADGSTDQGKVIYIPQNSLFWISEHPEEIAAKIEPTLFRLDPDFEAAHRQMKSELDTAAAAIRRAAEDWFREQQELGVAETRRKDLGGEDAIKKVKIDLEGKIETLRKRSSLTEEESATYEALLDQLGQIAVRRREIAAESTLLAPHLTKADSGYQPSAGIDATLRLTPQPNELPAAIRADLEDLVRVSEQQARQSLGQKIVEHQQKLDDELAELERREQRLRDENETLMSKNQANEEIDALVADKKKQDDALSEIAGRDKEIKRLKESATEAIGRLAAAIQRRDAAIDHLVDAFKGKERRLAGEMGFGIETGWSEDTRRTLSGRLNRHQRSDFVDRDAGVDLEKCSREPEAFLLAIRLEQQKVIKDQDPEEVAVDVLLASREVLFSAEIDDDWIGGFSASTMTPGKQALFALTLILNESEEAWPLLIDQPEDDLDSRSIYDVLVRYLCKRKKERQIIMVSHNANLVVGADSEQVMVANRHGDDGRENANARMFAYFSGSLEHSRQPKQSPVAFDRGGIREHACEILDGGVEAFRKRQEKYKIA